jgi:hypothetical protein
MYRAEAQSIEGFVQQLAVSYLSHGYYFYVTGWIPEGKDPRPIDSKLIQRYQIDRTKWDRARRKVAGQANLHYLRHDRFFLLLASHGQHVFFEQEGKRIRDARRVPVKFAGYAVSHRGGHSHVRIEQEQYKCVKAYLLDMALHRSAAHLERALGTLPFEPYAPVRRQLLSLLRAVNQVRKSAGFTLVDRSCLRFKRRIYRPFETADDTEEKVAS